MPGKGQTPEFMNPGASLPRGQVRQEYNTITREETPRDSFRLETPGRDITHEKGLLAPKRIRSGPPLLIYGAHPYSGARFLFFFGPKPAWRAARGRLTNAIP